jgi:hypothetical protein
MTRAIVVQMAEHYANPRRYWALARSDLAVIVVDGSDIIAWSGGPPRFDPQIDPWTQDEEVCSD